MIFLFLACTEQVEEKVQPEIRPAVTEQKVSFGGTESPLNRPEQVLSDWSIDVVESLKNPDKVIGIANLLRSPCVQEWIENISMAESVTRGVCAKTIDWLNPIDASLDSKSVQDILFEFTVPGPFFSNNKQDSVWYREDRKGSELIKSKIDNLKLDINLIEWSFEKQQYRVVRCGVEDSSCTHDWNQLSSTSWLNLHPDFANSSPVWFINGYLLQGLQTNRTLLHVSTLP
jgi:hypothetical protein